MDDAAVEDWLRTAAAALELDPLDPAEVSEVLKIARDAAHRVERRLVPPVSFLLGLRVAAADPDHRREALAEAVASLRSILPTE